MCKNSRCFQNIQHVVGGVQQVFLISTGVYIGKGNLIIAVVLGTITFLLNRISAELFYQTQKKVVQENTK